MTDTSAAAAITIKDNNVTIKDSHDNDDEDSLVINTNSDNAVNIPQNAKVRSRHSTKLIMPRSDQYWRFSPSLATLNGKMNE